MRRLVWAVGLLAILALAVPVAWGQNGTPGPDGKAAADQGLLEQGQEKASAFVRQSLESAGAVAQGLKDGIKQSTGLNDQQIYGIGAGLLAGVVAADVLGTGGLGSLAVVGLGGMIGNWVVVRNDPAAVPAPSGP